MAFPTTSTATTTSFATSVTSMAVNLPASIVSGNLLIAWVEVRNSGTWTLPTGWTQLFAPVAAGGVGDFTVFYRIADGTEGTTATWTASTATTATWETRLISNWHGTSPPEATTKNSGGTPSTNSFNTLTPSWGSADTLWFASMGTTANDTTITAAPTNYSDFVGNSVSAGGSSVNIGTAYRQLTAATETPGSFTTSSDRWWMTAAIAVRPAAAVAATSTPGLLSMGIGS